MNKNYLPLLIITIIGGLIAFWIYQQSNGNSKLRGFFGDINASSTGGGNG
jgi:hypothetical protein